MKLAVIVEPSCRVAMAWVQAPGFFGSCQFRMNGPPVVSYRRLVPPVVTNSISSTTAVEPGHGAVLAVKPVTAFSGMVLPPLTLFHTTLLEENRLEPRARDQNGFGAFRQRRRFPSRPVALGVPDKM